jgi:hypothetical protein
VAANANVTADTKTNLPFAGGDAGTRVRHRRDIPHPRRTAHTKATPEE